MSNPLAKDVANVSVNGRSVGAPVFNNDTLDADKELHLYILAKSGLQMGVATASMMMGSTTFPDLGRRLLWTTIQGLYEVGIVSANRQVVNSAWNTANVPSNNYSYVPIYDIVVDAPLHSADIVLSSRIAGAEDFTLPPVPQVAMVVNPLVQAVEQNVVAVPPPLHVGNQFVDDAYQFLYVGGAVGLWAGQIIKNGLDCYALPRGTLGQPKPYEATPSVTTQQNN